MREAFPPPVDAKSFADLPAHDVVKDDFGQVFVSYEELGHAALFADGSTKFRIAGGHPVLRRHTDDRGAPLDFEGDGPFQGVIQREQMQFYPGERASQSFPRRLFNGMCAGCHGAITGYELDVAVDVDALTDASETAARSAPAVDLTTWRDR